MAAIANWNGDKAIGVKNSPTRRGDSSANYKRTALPTGSLGSYLCTCNSKANNGNNNSNASCAQCEMSKLQTPLKTFTNWFFVAATQNIYTPYLYIHIYYIVHTVCICTWIAHKTATGLAHTHTDRHKHRQNDCQLQATNAFNSEFWHNNIMSIIKWPFACSFLVPDINANKWN